MGIFVGIGNYIGRVRQPIGPNDYYIITEDGIAVLTERGKHILLDKYVTEDGIVPPIHARRSVDGTMILLHEDFVAPVLGDEEISSYLYDSNELSEILNSEVWTEMN